MKNISLISLCLFLTLLIVMLPVCFADEIRATDGVEFTENTDSSKPLKNKRALQAASAVNVFPGLVSWLAAILGTAGITYIAIGAAAIAGGYLVYHTASMVWTYYKAYSYSKMADHAYKHISDFPNIWKKTPPKKDFEKKCKDTMNSKSTERYVQVKGASREIGRSISYDTVNEMLTVGDIDGKTIISCERRPAKDVAKKVNDGVYKKLR